MIDTFESLRLQAVKEWGEFHNWIATTYPALWSMLCKKYITHKKSEKL